ncbi:type II toxin-antitoxin system VapC family toxin [Paraburkholderia azotifigens]|uniref:type II toxin-antitoxin system VapC family toxin n=1 Tax=Paraburkholderia azotifigens TaxID=2057004 RepID=UPI0031789B95
MRKSSRANPGVQAFFGAEKEEGHRLYLSVVTVGELRRGVDAIRHRGDRLQALRLEGWLDTIMELFSSHILNVGTDVAQTWGHLRVPEPGHALDRLIAATALIYNLTVVTRNVADFEGTGARVLNPFQTLDA